MVLGLPAKAAEPDWPAAPYRYLVVDQDLRGVLEEFGRNLGLRVVLTDAVKGRVRGSLAEAPPRAFLDALARTYGLEWYFDGAVLHVSTGQEAATRFVSLQELPFASVQDGLQRAGLSDSRFTLQPGPGPGLARVSGPPRFVQLVAEAVAAMAAQRAPPAPPQLVAQVAAPIRVFRGSVGGAP